MFIDGSGDCHIHTTMILAFYVNHKRHLKKVLSFQAPIACIENIGEKYVC